MVDRLRDLFQQKIPEAIRSGAKPSDILKYNIVVGNDFQKALNTFDGIYALATLRFPFLEFKDCSDQELLELQKLFYETTHQSLESNNLSLIRWAQNVVTPGEKHNIIAHEKQHIDPLPDWLQNDAFIDLSFHLASERSSRKITVSGNARIDDFRAHPWYIAISASNPQVLGTQDRKIARFRARQTGDKEFIKNVRDRIKSRPHFR